MNCKITLSVTTMNTRLQTYCAIVGHDDPVRVELSGCTFVYDAKNAIVDAAKLKIPLARVELWKVS